MATNDRDGHLVDIKATGLSNKGVGTDNIEGGDTDDLAGVVLAGPLEGLRGDGDGGVDGVGDDVEDGVGAVLGNGLNELLDNAGIGVEEIVTGHSGLAGDTSGDDDELSTGKAGSEAVSTGIALNLDGGVDVAEVSSDTFNVEEIVESKLGDVLVALEEERKGLTDTTSGTHNGDLGGIGGNLAASRLASGGDAPLALLNRDGLNLASSEHL
mmetsp:Transcript_31587/g.57387  ORF Transcript_31587/g.57387 Transcript_31587/m.57387 type:complete len:212 (+) Transcript_31587:985-1620(+)